MQQKKNECKEDKYSVPGEPNGFYPCTHQEVLQEQGVLHKLLPLRAFRELICWDDPCSLCFGSSGDAGWKISHLQFACDAAHACSLLMCFVPHLPEAGRGVSAPHGQVGVSFWGFSCPAPIGSPAPAQRQCPFSPTTAIAMWPPGFILQSNSGRGLQARSLPACSLLHRCL